MAAASGSDSDSDSPSDSSGSEEDTRLEDVSRMYLENKKFFDDLGAEWASRNYETLHPLNNYKEFFENFRELYNSMEKKPENTFYNDNSVKAGCSVDSAWLVFSDLSALKIEVESQQAYILSEVDKYTGEVSPGVLKRLKKFRDTLYLFTAEEWTFGPANGMTGSGNAGIGDIQSIVGYMQDQETIIIGFKEAAMGKHVEEEAAVKAAMEMYENQNPLYTLGFNILDDKESNVMDKLIEIVGTNLYIPQIIYMFRITSSIDIDVVYVYADALVKKYSSTESDFPIFEDPPAATAAPVAAPPPPPPPAAAAAGAAAAAAAAAAGTGAAAGAAGAAPPLPAAGTGAAGGKKHIGSIRTQERNAYNSKMAKFRRGWQRLERAIQQGHVTVRVKRQRKKRKIELHSDLLFRLRF